MSDDAGAQKLAVMIVSMLAFATAGAIFSCYRICMEERLRRKQQQLSPSEDEPPTHIYNVVNLYQEHSPQTSAFSTTEQSDYQVIFGSASATSINEEVVGHRPLTELHIQNDFHSVPPYVSKDESLPTYDQAVSKAKDDD